MNTRLSRLGLPDLPEKAFMRRGQVITPFGKSDPPPPPDYAAAAQATSAGNLAAAQQATVANRPNQITPFGSVQWTNNRQFDQNAYNQALAAFNAQQQPSSANNSVSNAAQGYDPYAWLNNSNQPGNVGSFGPALTAPNPQDFYTGGDNWTQTTTLSPAMQALFDQNNQLQQGLFGAQNQALGRVNQTMAQPFDMSGVPQAGTALNISSLPGAGQVYDPNKATNNATDLLMARINPQLDRQQEQLRAQLANQGIVQGSDAYNTAMFQNQQARNDATNQAALTGINLGMQQQGQTFGQQTTNQQLAAALQGQQFNQSNAANSLAMQNQAYLRSLPLNELNALRTGNQVSMPQFPGFSQQATTGGPDLLNAANATYQAQVANNNAANAQSAGTLGGLFSLGSAAMGAPAGTFTGPNGLFSLFSDRRLKKHIKRIGKTLNGLSIYSYHYIWGGPTHIGYMADEVEKVAPWAVGNFGGLKTVDYARV